MSVADQFTEQDVFDYIACGLMRGKFSNDDLPQWWPHNMLPTGTVFKYRKLIRYLFYVYDNYPATSLDVGFRRVARNRRLSYRRASKVWQSICKPISPMSGEHPSRVDITC